jgi:hypothetical protein
MPGHIQILEENKHGEDYIIGDLHGSLAELEKILADLKPEDRLIIVGDLADRGPDSQKIFEKIKMINQQRLAAGLQSQIYVVKGNHEDLLLKYYKMKKQLLDFLTPELAMEYQRIGLAIQDISIAIENLEEKFDDEESDIDEDALETEIASKQIQLQKEGRKLTALYATVTNRNSGDSTQLDSYLNQYQKAEEHVKNRNIGGDWIHELSMMNPEKLNEIAVMCEAMPTIILVKGADPFVAVHASLRITYDELRQRMRSNNLTLSDEEDYYTIWARAKNSPVPIQEKIAMLWEPMVYCGHMILGGLRPLTHHANLDVGTYNTGLVCRVAHKAKKCEIISIASADEVATFSQHSTAKTNANLEKAVALAKEIQDFVIDLGLKRVAMPDPRLLFEQKNSSPVSEAKKPASTNPLEGFTALNNKGEKFSASTALEALRSRKIADKPETFDEPEIADKAKRNRIK